MTTPKPKPKKRVPWADHVLNKRNGRTTAQRMTQAQQQKKQAK